MNNPTHKWYIVLYHDAGALRTPWGMGFKKIETAQKWVTKMKKSDKEDGYPKRKYAIVDITKAVWK